MVADAGTAALEAEGGSFFFIIIVVVCAIVALAFYSEVITVLRSLLSLIFHRSETGGTQLKYRNAKISLKE